MVYCIIQAPVHYIIIIMDRHLKLPKLLCKFSLTGLAKSQVLVIARQQIVNNLNNYRLPTPHLYKNLVFNYS